MSTSAILQQCFHSDQLLINLTSWLADKAKQLIYGHSAVGVVCCRTWTSDQLIYDSPSDGFTGPTRDPLTNTILSITRRPAPEDRISAYSLRMRVHSLIIRLLNRLLSIEKSQWELISIVLFLLQTCVGRVVFFCKQKDKSCCSRLVSA